MILRRFIKHVSEQNWLAVAIDVLVVFGSVVLATQFSEGIESRRAQDALTTAMSRVSGELNASYDNMQEQGEIWEDRLNALQQLMSALEKPDQTEINAGDLNLALHTIFTPIQLYTQYDLITELQNSEGLRMVPQDDLHGALRELMFQYKMLASRNNAWKLAQSKTTLSQFPYIHSELNRDSSGNWGTMRFSGIDWDTARRDPALRSATVQAHHNVRAMRIQLEAGKAMAAEVDKIMNAYGYGEDTTWYERTGEAVERAAFDRIRKQLSLELSEDSDK
ncbi:MAG: hypothetical protein AAF438_21275 [Pseudomonadota bacterium]